MSAGRGAGVRRRPVMNAAASTAAQPNAAAQTQLIWAKLDRNRAAVQDGVAAAGYVRDVIERVTPGVLAAHAAGLTGDGDFITGHIRHTAALLLDRSAIVARAAVPGLAYRLTDGGATRSPPTACRVRRANS
jgi:hypothetical protein